MKRPTMILALGILGSSLWCARAGAGDSEEHRVTARKGEVKKDKRVRAPFDTTQPESIGTVNKKIKITSKTFKPPLDGNEWSFERFKAAEDFVEVIVSPANGTADITTQGPKAIKVFGLLPVPRNAGTYPLRAEGNLKPPAVAGKAGEVKEWHWAAKVGACRVDVAVDGIYPDEVRVLRNGNTKFVWITVHGTRDGTLSLSPSDRVTVSRTSLPAGRKTLVIVTSGTTATREKEVTASVSIGGSVCKTFPITVVEPRKLRDSGTGLSATCARFGARFGHVKGVVLEVLDQSDMVIDHGGEWDEKFLKIASVPPRPPYNSKPPATTGAPIVSGEFTDYIGVCSNNPADFTVNFSVTREQDITIRMGEKGHEVKAKYERRQELSFVAPKTFTVRSDPR
jgi:hypothetical protein